MIRKVLFLFWIATLSLKAQVYHPAPHQQQHDLPRGAYVACVDNMVQEMAGGTSQQLQDLIGTIDRHDLSFLAFYGLHYIVDNNPQDNPEEAQLRVLLNQLRSRFPKLQIAAVGGGLQNPSPGKINAQEFEHLKTDNFLFKAVSDEACPNQKPGLASLAKLNAVMNPRNPTAQEQYQAEVLKFFARIASSYGFANPASRSTIRSGKALQSQDYFDHLVLEDEWWWRNGLVSDHLNDHEDLLRAMRSILQLSHACEAKVMTYESLQIDSSGLVPMDQQAQEIAALADRVFVTHYFKCVPNTLDRYCEVIEAWGKLSGAEVELWPLFSSEDQSAKVSCSRFDPSKSWNDFWGEWMDTSFTAANPPPDFCPGPGRSGYGYPYETDEAEDLYLERLDSTGTARLLPNSTCPVFHRGSYEPGGFMWFIAHLMDPYNRSRVGLKEVEDLKASPVLFPNPANESVSLSYGTLISISGLSGESLNQKIKGSKAQLNDLAPGLYLVKVWANERYYFLKLQKS